MPHTPSRANVAPRWHAHPRRTLIAAALLQALALGAATAAPGQVSLTDVAAGQGGFVLRQPFEPGRFNEGSAGYSVAGAGDVNGDGLADLVVGAPFAPCDGGNTFRCGRTYVVFGRAGGTPINLREVENGVGGFVIYGADGQDEQHSGYSVSGGCDINGDGLDDVVLGAPRPFDVFDDVRAFKGRGVVVFGKADGAPVIASPGDLGSAGIVLLGVNAPDEVGDSVGCAGDVNDDGLADVVVSAPRDAAAYLVFGRTDPGTIALGDVAAGTGGFLVRGLVATRGPVSAAGAGDINGDGRADLVIGVPFASVGTFSSGRAYVVFGKADSAPVNAADLMAGTGGGFVVNGNVDTDYLGHSVAGAGDVNGDGLADLVLGAPNAFIPPDAANARALVVFGKADTAAVDAGALSRGEGGGFEILGAPGDTQLGSSVAGAGDLNGDGLADVIIGAIGTNSFQGEAYVVWGKPGIARVDVAALRQGTGGFTVTADTSITDPFVATGSAVAAAGDVNADGLGDLIVGAWGLDSAYVVHGRVNGPFRPTRYTQVGDDTANTLTGTPATEGLAGGAGDDTLSGEGGADVLVGGPGADRLVLTRGHLQALQATPARGAARATRVDGGAGDDTLAFRGSDLGRIDLRRIPQVAMPTPGGTSRLASIETIDLAGHGASVLGLSARVVHGLAGMNRIHAGNQAALGWSNGSYSFQPVESRHQLVITGDSGPAGDTLALSGRWTVAGTVSRDGVPYTVLNSRTGRAQLLVAQGVDPGAR